MADKPTYVIDAAQGERLYIEATWDDGDVLTVETAVKSYTMADLLELVRGSDDFTAIYCVNLKRGHSEDLAEEIAAAFAQTAEDGQTSTFHPALDETDAWQRHLEDQDEHDRHCGFDTGPMRHGSAQLGVGRYA